MKIYTNVYCQGNTIYYKEIDGNQKRNLKESYTPTLYINTQKDSPFKSLKGESLEPVGFESIKEARDFIKSNSDIDNFSINGMTAWEYAFISEEYPGDLDFSMKDINIGNMDIEVRSDDGFPEPDEAKFEVLTITIKDFNQNHYTVFHHNKNFNKAVWYEKNKARSWKVDFISCQGEEYMLDAFLKYFRKANFDIITGWNVRMFDVPYLVQRITNLFGFDKAKNLSPWNIVKEGKIAWMGNDVRVFDIAGVSIVDYMQIYKKFVNDPRESYKLDYIAEVELGLNKHKYDGSLQDLYDNDFDTFITYNIVDVELVELLDIKMQLMELTIYMAYKAKVNYVDVLSQVRMWDVKIYNILLGENIIIPLKESHEKNEAYVGAYVKEPIPGLYDWVCSIDVASLYPSIIKLLNIGIETKVEKLEDIGIDDFLKETKKYNESIDLANNNNYTLSVNGVLYRKNEKSFYSRLIESMFEERMMYKDLAKKAKSELQLVEHEMKIRGLMK